MSKPDHPDPFDFDRWAELASRDAEAFEQARQAAIERIIDASPPAMQQRLRGLQWRIDRVRRQSGTPVGACVKLSQMMWESILGPEGLVDHIERLRQPGEAADARPRADVLPFRDRPARREGAAAPDTHPPHGRRGPDESE